MLELTKNHTFEFGMFLFNHRRLAMLFLPLNETLCEYLEVKVLGGEDEHDVPEAKVG